MHSVGFPLSDVTFAVLAGGKSSRLGRDKLLLELDGRTLLQRAVGLGQRLCPETLILSNRTDEFASLGVRVAPDNVPGAGPLAGIEAALRAASHAWVLVVAADMPNLTEEFLSEFGSERGNAEIVAYFNARGRVEPCCALYHTSLAERATGLLQQENRRVSALFDLARTQIRLCPDNPALFDNINYPEDWDRLRK